MKKILILFFIFAQFVYCQQNVDKLLYLTSNKIGLTVQYQSLSIGNEKLSQIAFPVSLTIPVSNRITVNLYNGSALTKQENVDINGIGETRLGIRYIFPGEKLMVRGLFGLPSGKTKLNDDQFMLSQLLSLNPLDYMVSYYGQGFNSNISLAYALPISRALVLGLGAAYNYRGTFTPREADVGGEFDPGDEISADVGLDFKLSESVKINFDVLYTVYSKDKLDAVDIFQLGNKISIYTGINLRAFGVNHNLFAINRIRANNRSFSEENQADLTTGSQVDISYYGLVPLSPMFSLILKAGGKFYKDSEQMIGGSLFRTGEASIIGFGGGLKLNPSDYVVLELNAEYKTGNIKLPLTSSKDDVSGISTGLGFIFRF